MKIGRVVLVLLMATALAVTVACGNGEAEPTPTPEATPTPAPTLPDLTITDVTFDPAVGCEGAPVEVSVTIENQGTLLSPTCHWSWQLYQGSVEKLEALPSLPPGGSIIVQTEMSLDEDITGTFNTTARVDPMATVAEINDSNNEFITPFTIMVCDFEGSYGSDKNNIQTAMDAYKAANNGSVPLTGNEVQLNYPAGTYAILDICALIGEGELLDEVPASSRDDSFDNCASDACSCKQNAHYIWLVDLASNVLSVCIGGDCDTNFADGYQGIWP
jgi:hypothetical protein